MKRLKPFDEAKIYIQNEKDQEGFELKYTDDFMAK
jgi:hypothetical protein